MQTAHEHEVGALKEQLKQLKMQSTVAMDRQASEIETLNNQLQAKNNFSMKMEQSFQMDISRLENKLLHQVMLFILLL